MKVEHINITVGDLNEVMEFLQAAMPDFKIRGQGESDNEGVPYHWLHLGTDDCYVALQQPTAKKRASLHRYADVGTNHIGFVIDNINTLVKNLAVLGYNPSLDNQDHPARRRVYFETRDGLEWEFIQYYTTDLRQRNDYII